MFPLGNAIGVIPKPVGIPCLLSYVPGNISANDCIYTVPLLPSGLVTPVANTMPLKAVSGVGGNRIR